MSCEGGAGAGEPAHYRSDRNGERFGGFAVGHAGDGHHGEHFALFVGEPVDTLLRAAEGGLSRDALFGRDVEFGVCREIDSRLAAHLPRAEVIDPDIAAHPEHPFHQFNIVGQRAREHPFKRGLDQVVGVIRMTRQSVCKPPDLRDQRHQVPVQFCPFPSHLLQRRVGLGFIPRMCGIFCAAKRQLVESAANIKRLNVRTGRFPLKSHVKSHLKIHMKPCGILLGGALLLAPGAMAQLPGGQLPGGLGDGPIIRGIQGTVDRTVDRPLTDPLNDQLQRSVEKLQKATDIPKSVLDPLLQGPLLPARKDVPVEDNWRALDHEWVALLTPEQMPALRAADVQILSQRTLSATGMVLVRVVVSDQDNRLGQADALLRSLGATAADRNHIYDERSGPDVDEAPAPEAPAPQGTSGGRAVIGLIDTSLVRKHAAFTRATISERDFVESSNPRPTAHGTAIASVLIGNERGHKGLLPGARLVAASVFYQGESGATGATTSALVAALDWMSAEDVQVVNMSLAGPPNQVLGAMIDTLSKRGMIIVAAVGNDGPASRPLYPAAFDPVVAVTAVDRQKQVYRWANQGPQVDFAAWGVKTPVARVQGGYGEESGTSFAAPVVAATLAGMVAKGSGTASAAVKALIGRVEDLGPAGRDNTYGYGLVKPAS